MSQPAASTSATAPADPPIAAPARGLKDAAQDLQSGAGNPGSVSITNRMRRSAGAMFDGSVNLHGGTLVGRDQTNISVHLGAIAEVTLHKTSPAERAALSRVFVEPAGFTQLVAALQTRRIIIVRGPVGSGRGALALALLGECGATDIFRFGAGADLSLLRSEQVTSNAGYLWTDLTDTQARVLQGFALRTAEDLLEAANARLIITITEHARLVDPDVLDLVMPMGQPADPMSVLRRHLEAVMGQAPVQEMLNDPENKEKLGELVVRGRDQRHVARVAMLCSEEFVNGSLRVGRVIERASSEDQADFADWFDNLPDLASRAHAISLAVFHKLSYRTVATQAESLQRFIERPNLPEDVVLNAQFHEVTRDPFGQSRSKRLHLLRARVVAGSVTTLYGEVPTDVVMYHDSRYPEALLLRIRTEFPDIQRPLLDWLRMAGTSADDSVRIWAAQAAGFLACLDFPAVLSAVIAPWASSNDPGQRDAAAFTLEAPSANGLQTQVLNLIQLWSTDERPQLMMTAARAYGASIGRTDPELALTKLEELTDDDDYDIALAAARSMADLIDHDVSLANDVLALLNRWLRSTNQNHKDAAELAFLLIASETVAPADQVGSDDAAVQWPLLLKLADQDIVLRQTIGAFWRQVLNGRMFSEPARHVLTQWARSADPDRRPCSALARLATEMTTEPGSAALQTRTRKILTLLADQWAGTAPAHQAVASRAAAAVRTVLPS